VIEDYLLYIKLLNKQAIKTLERLSTAVHSTPLCSSMTYSCADCIAVDLILSTHCWHISLL